MDKLLPLTSTDLDALEDEPEEWLIGESTDAEAWAFEFRPCAERVLIALNNACRNVPRENKVIEPAMLKLLSETQRKLNSHRVDADIQSFHLTIYLRSCDMSLYIVLWGA